MALGGASGRRKWSASDEKRAQEEAAEMDEELVISQILRLWPKDQPRPDMEKVKELSAKQLQGKDPKALSAVRRSNGAQVVTESQMSAVKVPTIGIVGTADPYMKDFQQLKAVMPQMKLVLIEGASHGNAARRPEFVNEEFLTAHAIQDRAK
jgi:pimeloyl-ACP methyl ester carboxylesterase